MIHLKIFIIYLQNLRDLSQNVQGIKNSNTLQDIKLFGHGLNISANTDALVTLGTTVATNVTATGVNTAAIGTVIATIGIPTVAGITPSTGLYAGIAPTASTRPSAAGPSGPANSPT